MPTFAPQGTLTALVSPLSKTASQIDWDAYERLVERQIQAGVSAVVPCGTTGESPTLSPAEKVELVRRALRIAGGRVPILAGMGSADTAASVAQAQQLQEAGATALMLVMPAYSRPSQEGLERHVAAVAGSCDLPLVLYDVPGRTAVSLELDTLERIATACPNVVALKDASGHVLNCQRILRRLGDRVTVICGDDGLTVPMMSVGARGVISVTANILPEAVVGVTSAALRGDYGAAAAAHLKLLAVHEALFSDASPAPVKAAMASRGWLNDSLRLPLVPANAAAREKLTEALGNLETVASRAAGVGRG